MVALAIDLVDGHVENGAGEEEGDEHAADGIVNRGYGGAAEGGDRGDEIRRALWESVRRLALWYTTVGCEWESENSR